MRTPWIVGVSGASGTPYARAVLGALRDAGESVDLVISKAARLTLLDETGATGRDAHWKDDVAAWLRRGPTGGLPHCGAARLTLLRETGATVRDAHWKDDVAAWLGRDLTGDLSYWPASDLAAGPSS